MAYLQHHFASLGVNKLLRRAGAENGDDVTIAGAVFEYFDDDGNQAGARAAARSEAVALRAAERRYVESRESAAGGEAEPDQDDEPVTEDDEPDGSGAGQAARLRRGGG